VMSSDATDSGKYINSTKKRIREEGAKRSRTVKPGDFLLTNSMSFGRPYIMNTSGCIHDGWLVLSPRDGNVRGISSTICWVRIWFMRSLFATPRAQQSRI